MKLVFIVYNSAIEEEVMELLGDQGIESYTKWQEVVGVGRLAGPHLGTHIWPAKNSVIAVVVDDKIARVLMDEVRRLRAGKLAREGIKAFLLPVEDIT